MNWRWLLVIPFAYGAWNHWHSRPVHHSPGILAAAEPSQTDAAVNGVVLERNGYRITPLQAFSIEARVLGAERYRFDREADIAPVDLALGWGPMSDQAV